MLTRSLLPACVVLAERNWLGCLEQDSSLINPTSSQCVPGIWRSARQPVHGGAMRADDLSLLRLKDSVLPTFRGFRPVGRVLPMQQHDVKVSVCEVRRSSS